MTAQDKDTYSQDATSTTLVEFANTSLICTVSNEQYKTVAFPPTGRGSAPDGTMTWDLVGFGVTYDSTAKGGKAHAKAQVYYNSYQVTDNGKVLVDAPVVVIQTLIFPGY